MKQVLVDVHMGRRPSDPLLLAAARKRGFVIQDRATGTHAITPNGKQALEDLMSKESNQ